MIQQTVSLNAITCRDYTTKTWTPRRALILVKGGVAVDYGAYWLYVEKKTLSHIG